MHLHETLVQWTIKLIISGNNVGMYCHVQRDLQNQCERQKDLKFSGEILGLFLQERTVDR